jgi:DNA-binding NarL/FixJ family response regulator
MRAVDSWRGVHGLNNRAGHPRPDDALGDGLRYRAFNAGASGFVTKYSPAADFIEAVSKIASGGVYVDFATAHEFAQSFDQAAALPPPAPVWS